MDTPDLFPGLTADDRAKLAAIAGKLESLPELVDRLMGYTADLAKARASTPALVVPNRTTWPESLGARPLLDPNTSAPLEVAPDGALVVRTSRILLPARSLSILAGGGNQWSEWTSLEELGWVNFGQSFLIDDLTRAVGETVNVEGWFSETPPPVGAGGWTLQTNILGATVGIVAAFSNHYGVARKFRLRSAVPVAASRTFQLRAYSSS